MNDEFIKELEKHGKINIGTFLLGGAILAYKYFIEKKTRKRQEKVLVFYPSAFPCSHGIGFTGIFPPRYIIF